MPSHFTLEWLFKINITLLQCKIVGTKEEQLLTFLPEIHHFSHVLVKLLLPLFCMKVVFLFAFYFSSSFWFPWFVCATCKYLCVARDHVDFLLSHTHRARKDVGCQSNTWYHAFEASTLDKDGNIRMSNCCVCLPSPECTQTSVQGAIQQVSTSQTNMYITS